jgi:hypothetical protein
MGCFDVSGLVRTSMKLFKLNSTDISRSLLIQLITAHIFGTIFAYTVYIKFSLGDGYLPEDFKGFYGEMSSTLFVHGIYAFIGAILPDQLTPMALGIVIAVLIWDSFRKVYPLVNRKIFWLCNLFPHFLIWSGSSSKEQIVIICGIVAIDYSVKKMFSIGVTYLRTVLALLSLVVIFYIRPNYFIIYATVFIISIIIPSSSQLLINKLSFGVYVLISINILLALVILLIYNLNLVSDNIFDFMKLVEISFLSLEGNTTRWDIQWSNVSDFFKNSIWGVPQGLIGPTLSESILSPILFPVFFEGITYLFILFYLFYKLLFISKFHHALRFKIMTYIFVSLIIVYVSYPYLIFNVGSSLRYKQSMHPILFFFPLLVIAHTKLGKISNSSPKFSVTSNNLRNLVKANQ